MKIMVHPLQIQVLYLHRLTFLRSFFQVCGPALTMFQHVLLQACLSEIHSNMWVRNGLQIKGQAMTYVQSHFCNSMIDPDIYLLQV